MKKLINIFLVLILLLFFVSSANTADEGSKSDKFSVIEPVVNSMFEGELMDIVVKVNDSGLNEITVTNKGSDTWKVLVTKGKEYYCKTIVLDYGPNELVFNASREGKIIESKKVNVFFRADISKEFRRSPPEFQKKEFHQGSRDSVCNPCHRIEITEKDIKPLKPENSVCHQCHKKIALYNYVHGPVSRGDCLRCHNKDSKPVRFATQKPDSELCFICHKEKKDEWAPKKYMHGPAATGKCTICHNAHASNNIAWLRKPSWDLCVTCHEDRASGAHVVIGFTPGSTHPTKGKPDPVRYGKEISCASCHSPHASNSKSLFPNDAPSFDGLCQMCHKM